MGDDKNRVKPPEKQNTITRQENSKTSKIAPPLLITPVQICHVRHAISTWIKDLYWLTINSPLTKYTHDCRFSRRHPAETGRGKRTPHATMNVTSILQECACICPKHRSNEHMSPCETHSYRECGPISGHQLKQPKM